MSDIVITGSTDVIGRRAVRQLLATMATVAPAAMAPERGAAQPAVALTSNAWSVVSSCAER